MSRAIELQEERDLAAWRSDQWLFAAALRYIVARAAKCTVASCRAVAFWRWSTPRAWSGFPRDELACDAHKRPDSIELRGADVLRKVVARCRA